VTDPRPIGVFDSGVGGLTVLSEILRRLPDESTTYLGDNARAPYGVRPNDEIRRFSGECLAKLVAQDVKAIVVACNTSSAVALEELRERFDVPILGVVRPGAAAAALATRNGRIGVIATPATVRSRAYFAAIKDENAALHVDEQATPELVPLVEAGIVDGPEAEAAVRRSVAPLADKQADTLLLGCTHYPLLRPVIVRVVGPATAVVDAAAATAGSLAELLAVNGLQAPGGRDGSVTHRQLTTGDVASFERIARVLFGDEFTDVAAVQLGEDPADTIRAPRFPAVSGAR
jgi:glutamate racemase